MPKKKDTILRQWAMLRLIPRAPQMKNTRAIYEALVLQDYKVDIRTVQRDLDSLSTDFKYSCAPAEGPLGNAWFWPEDVATIDIPGLELPTAVALLLSEKHLTPLLPAKTMDHLRPYFKRAEEVVGKQKHNALASWRNKVMVIARGPQLEAPHQNSDAQDALYQALLNGKQVRVQYRGRGNDATSESDLHPLGMVVKEGVTYLVATAWDYPDPRHYVLHRFQSATVLEDKAKTPPGFELDEYVSKQKTFSYPESSDTLKLELAMDADLAEHLRERKLSAGQTINPIDDGRVRISAVVADTAELRWWLLGLGPGVEVLGPRKLRARIRTTVQQLSKLYPPV